MIKINLMKIVWAIPEFDDPKTGGEKVYAKLKENFLPKSEILVPSGLVFASRNNILGEIGANIKNFELLLPYAKKALIFQDLYYRRKFLLANIFLSFFFGRKIVLFVNEEYSLSGFSLKGKIARRIINYLVFKSAHKIIVNSRSTAEWVSSFGYFRHKLHVYYPVLGNNIKKAAIPKIRSKHAKNLLCVANIKKSKGQEYLIKAMGILDRKDINLKFVGLIREETYFNYLLERIKENELSERVKFMGFLKGEDLLGAYNNADVFVLPTLKEGFGMVLLEAMSFGLPVVASNIGGIPEIIRNGVDGLLVPAASPEELAEALKEIIEDEEFRKRLGNNAFEKSQKMFTWNESFQNLCEYLNESSSI